MRPVRPSGAEETRASSPNRPTSVDGLLAEARAELDRLTPSDARTAAERGAALIDIRTPDQRGRDGTIPGATVIPRNVLEWRLDPASPHREPAFTERGRRIILICHEGYQSSLAAAAVKAFGVDATDVKGGFAAWRAEGLPVERGP